MRYTLRILIVSHFALPHVGGVENLVDLEVLRTGRCWARGRLAHERWKRSRAHPGIWPECSHRSFHSVAHSRTQTHDTISDFRLEFLANTLAQSRTLRCRSCSRVHVHEHLSGNSRGPPSRQAEYPHRSWWHSTIQFPTRHVCRSAWCGNRGSNVCDVGHAEHHL